MANLDNQGSSNSPTNVIQSPRIKEIVLSDQLDSSRNTSYANSLQSSKNRSSTKLKKLKSKPHLKRLTSSTHKLIYSVDDDINDIDENAIESDDNNKAEYLEGYNDALRALYSKKSKSLISQNGSYLSEINDNEAKKSFKPEGEYTQSNQSAKIDSNVNLATADDNLKILETDERNPSNIINEEGEDNNEDVESIKSSSSSNTIESLNLRERQDAINSTHPFGIKIWKPSLYKKKRSVATRAEEDIHDFDPHKPTTKIFWGVYVSNVIWSLTFGLSMYIICILGTIIVFVFSGFAIHRHSRPYVKLLFKLGKYWLFPFGKFVILNKDENYLDEDEFDGRTISEFHKWRSQEEGRLFFAPPRRYTNSNESRPLLKDHKGRPLRDAYSSLDDNNNDDDLDLSDIKVRFFGRGNWSSGRLMFYIYFYGVLQPLLYLIALLCWLFVFTIPMANLTNIVCDHLRRHPLALDFESEKQYYKSNQKRRKHQSIILCTYRCCGFHYYKYTIDGTNIFFINLLAAVIFVILDYYLLKEKLGWQTWFTDSLFLFCACLFSIIPLAYFIGQAVASISAQSSMGVGAVINAFFSTVVEIFLYCVALNQAKGKLVEGSMIGSILGGVLLLPGLSMCGGAVKRKTQRYNPRSAGVSSTMLLYASVIMFAPSLFYQIYGSYEIKCKKCEVSPIKEYEDDCTKCRFIQPSFTLDSFYYTIIKPFSLIVAIALFLAYVCGLFFTLRTHASLIWATSHETTKKDEILRSPSIASLDTPKLLPRTNLPPSATFYLESRASSSKAPVAYSSPELSKNKATKDKSSLIRRASQLDVNNEVVGHDVEEHDVGGHDAPNWSRNKSAVILLSATLIYAVIAEILVDNVDSVLSDFSIGPKILGLTVFALVPNTTEFLNAISFALGGNVALSMEIGSAYALQVVLIQIPSLVVYSIYKGFVNVDQIFSLVFPRWDIIATFISIYLFTYIYAEGKSNYFKGVILILIYSVVLIGFWFNDKIEELDDGYNGRPKVR